MAYKEFSVCSFHAEKQVLARREVEYKAAFQHGSVLVAAMLAEGEEIDRALEPLKLNHLEKIEYVANNSVFIKANDGHEAIQVVWASAQAICVHRLLTREARTEFQRLWLGVWSEPLEGRSNEAFVSLIERKLEYRELMRSEVGLNVEIDFAVSPAVQMPSYSVRT